MFLNIRYLKGTLVNRHEKSQSSFWLESAYFRMKLWWPSIIWEPVTWQKVEILLKYLVENKFIKTGICILFNTLIPDQLLNGIYMICFVMTMIKIKINLIRNFVFWIKDYNTCRIYLANLCFEIKFKIPVGYI